MKEHSILLFAGILLIACAVLLFGTFLIVMIESTFRNRAPQLIRAAQISFGIFMLTTVALGIFGILYSWTPAGTWQIWATIGITCLIGIFTALLSRKWVDERIEKELSWVLLLFIVAFVVFPATFISLILEHAKWQI